MNPALIQVNVKAACQRTSCHIIMELTGIRQEHVHPKHDCCERVMNEPKTRFNLKKNTKLKS